MCDNALILNSENEAHCEDVLFYETGVAEPFICIGSPVMTA